MTALEVVDAYLTSRRALGVRLTRDARSLRQFVRETGNLPLSDVTPESVADFLRGSGVLSANSDILISEEVCLALQTSV